MKLDVTATFKDLEGNTVGTTTHVATVLENDHTSYLIDSKTRQPKIIQITDPEKALTAMTAVAYSLDALKVEDWKADMDKYALIEKVKKAKKYVEISDNEKEMIAKALFENKGIDTYFRGQLISSIK